MIYTWDTEKGAKVNMTVETVSDKRIIDGIEFTDKPEIKITSLTVNGNKYDAKFGNCKYDGLAMFKVGNQNAGVKIPDVIYNDIYRDQNKKVDAMVKADIEYQRHVNSVYRTLNQ